VFFEARNIYHLEALAVAVPLTQPTHKLCRLGAAHPYDILHPTNNL
jgi:hypothetical protein